MTVMILFDTNILIDHLKGKAEAALLLRECLHSQKPPACSVLTRIELLSGMRPGEEKALEGFLSGFEEIPVNREIAGLAGAYMRKYRKSHGINLADAVIAASARFASSRLYTLNAKHYPMDDVVVVKPY